MAENALNFENHQKRALNSESAPLNYSRTCVQGFRSIFKNLAILDTFLAKKWLKMAEILKTNKKPTSNSDSAPSN